MATTKSQPSKAMFPLTVFGALSLLAPFALSPIDASAELTDSIPAAAEKEIGGAAILFEDGSAGPAIMSYASAVYGMDSTFSGGLVGVGTETAEDAEEAIRLASWMPGFVGGDIFYEGDMSVASSVLPTPTSNDPMLNTWQYNNTNVGNLWDDLSSETEIIVAVLDTGVNETAELAGRVLPGADFTGENDGSWADTHGHGTFVAEQIAGHLDNELGSYGICQQCKILPVQVLAGDGMGSSLGVAQGVQWAVDNGADVLNLSLGGSGYSSTIEAFYLAAREAGVPVLAAAGNNGMHWDALGGGFYPAAYSGVISVAASYEDYSKTGFSNWDADADGVDISAPGCVYAASGGYWCGTSMATPVAAGVTALMVAQFPDFTLQELESRLFSFATTNSNDYTVYGHISGYGLLDAAVEDPVDIAPPEAPEPLTDVTFDWGPEGQFVESASGYLSNDYPVVVSWGAVPENMEVEVISRRVNDHILDPKHLFWDNPSATIYAGNSSAVTLSAYSSAVPAAVMGTSPTWSPSPERDNVEAHLLVGLRNRILGENGIYSEWAYSPMHYSARESVFNVTSIRYDEEMGALLFDGAKSKYRNTEVAYQITTGTDLPEDWYWIDITYQRDCDGSYGCILSTDGTDSGQIYVDADGIVDQGLVLHTRRKAWTGDSWDGTEYSTGWQYQSFHLSNLFTDPDAIFELDAPIRTNFSDESIHNVHYGELPDYTVIPNPVEEPIEEDPTIEEPIEEEPIEEEPIEEEPVDPIDAVPGERLFDTREEEGMQDKGLSHGTTTYIQIAGRGGVPENAHSAVVSIAAINPAATGHGTLFPCAGPEDQAPDASVINYTPGKTRANGAMTGLGPTGGVCFFTVSETGFLLDVQSYSVSSDIISITPKRIFDSRHSEIFKAGEVRRYTVDNLEASAKAVYLNLTSTGVASNGFATIFPCASTQDPVPNSSILNYVPGADIANNALVGLIDGGFCVYTIVETHLIGDVTGFVLEGADNFTPIEPDRFLDTRLNNRAAQSNYTVLGWNSGRFQAGETRMYDIGGAGYPANQVKSVIANFTAVAPSGSNHLTVWACESSSEKVPNTSLLNYHTSWDATPNNSTVPVSASGTICVYSYAETDIIIDISAIIS